MSRSTPNDAAPRAARWRRMNSVTAAAVTRTRRGAAMESSRVAVAAVVVAGRHPQRQPGPRSRIALQYRERVEPDRGEYAGRAPLGRRAAHRLLPRFTWGWCRAPSTMRSTRQRRNTSNRISLTGGSRQGPRRKRLSRLPRTKSSRTSSRRCPISRTGRGRPCLRRCSANTTRRSIRFRTLRSRRRALQPGTPRPKR